MKEPRGQILIDRYRTNYGIDPEAHLTEEMILAHWELEKSLRHKLYNSTPENRWEVFEKCYTRLYSELTWLNELTTQNYSKLLASVTSFRLWRQLVGDPPARIFEIGSGRAELIEYLAGCGYECKASEITNERGDRFTSPHPNLVWGITDGIHLEQFEPPNHYDVTISNQVIEHMHPDDLLDHFRGVCTILKPGGRYILATPHASAGPADISAVFLTDTPLGMHLKEYTYAELNKLLIEAGFSTLKAPLRLPKKLRCILPLKPLPSRLYLAYLLLLEELLTALPNQKQRREASRLDKALLFATNIMIVAEK